MSGNLFNFFQFFYNSAFVPLQYFNGNELVLQQPQSRHLCSFASNYIQPLLDSGKSVAYIETRDFNFFGMVKSRRWKDEYVIVGPITGSVCSADTLRSIMLDAYIEHRYFEEVSELFQTFPVMTFLQFLHVLALFHLELNHEEIGTNDIFNVENPSLVRPVESRYTKEVYQARENQSFHNTYHFERKLFQIVEDGDPEGLRKFLQKPTQLKAGTIAEDNLRQVKNLFIVIVTLATRSAIRGDLDIEVAYKLSDTYIMQIEKLQNSETVYQLQYAMLMDFTKRVSTTHIPAGISGIVYDCIQFISMNINRPISVCDVAVHLGKNRSYLSRKFKEEMGFDISSFIMRKKLEEAKSMLSFTDKTISEISYYLCFSTQSYFQNVFKKKYGITPLEYRNRSKHG